MAWVRYDDQFPINPKVTAVVAEDPGALSLHVLANTWSNTTKAPGYVPSHQPAILLCDRTLGLKWAEVLVQAGLWHERGKECDDCRAEYVALANDEAKRSGWVFHNAKTYQAPARDRATPGTPADLSEKRRSAGRKGGQASAAKRAEQASEANGVSKDSTCSNKSVSPDPDPVPDPVLPAEAEEPPAGAVAQQLAIDGMAQSPAKRKKQTRVPSPADEAFGLARWRIDEREKAGTPIIANTQRGALHALKAILEPAFAAGYTEDEIRAALSRIRDGIPSKQHLNREVAAVRAENLNGQDRADGTLARRDSPPPQRRSTSTARAEQALSIAEELDREHGHGRYATEGTR